jgi:hypothetical protein
MEAPGKRSLAILITANFHPVTVEQGWTFWKLGARWCYFELTAIREASRKKIHTE